MFLKMDNTTYLKSTDGSRVRGMYKLPTQRDFVFDYLKKVGFHGVATKFYFLTKEGSRSSKHGTFLTMPFIKLL